MLQPRCDTIATYRAAKARCSSNVTFSGMTGIDPYGAAVSDVYQDLFGEGSYAGKGIYDIDAFEGCAGRSSTGRLAAQP